jgi:hypothetical protein
VLPPALTKLATFERNAWTAFHHRGQRRMRGCGWNRTDPLPVVPWIIEENLPLTVDFCRYIAIRQRIQPLAAACVM